MNTNSLPAFAAFILTGWAACAQDFAVESIRFQSPSGSSSDGAFVVSGTITPAAVVVMTGGEFEISGAPLSVVAAREVIAIGGVALVGENVALTIKTVLGRTYSVETRDSLESGSWQPVPGTETPGTGDVVEIIMADAPGEVQRFYRVRMSR